MKEKKIAILCIIIWPIFIISIIFGFVFLQFVSNSYYKQKYINKYSNDTAYIELEGIVTKTYEDDNMFSIYTYSQTNGYLKKLDKNENTFEIYSFYDDKYDLNVFDYVKIKSGTKSYYRNYPLVYIERNEEVLLDFAKGKADYIEWLKKNY